MVELEQLRHDIEDALAEARAEREARLRLIERMEQRLDRILELTR